MASSFASDKQRGRDFRDRRVCAALVGPTPDHGEPYRPHRAAFPHHGPLVFPRRSHSRDRLWALSLPRRLACKLRCVSSAGARDRGGAAPGEWLASGTSAMHYYAQDMRSQVRASPARIPAAVLAYSSPSSATLAGMERAPIFETLRSWRGLRAEDRFDDEPRDLIGKTVFVKDHGQGQVLDFSKARIGSSQ